MFSVHSFTYGFRPYFLGPAAIRKGEFPKLFPWQPCWEESGTDINININNNNNN